MRSPLRWACLKKARYWTLATLLMAALVLAFAVNVLCDILSWTVSAATNVTVAIKPEGEKEAFSVGNYTAVLAKPEHETLRAAEGMVTPLLKSVAAVVGSPMGVLVLLVIGIIILAYENKWIMEG